jgi:hypothetical protein
VPPGINAIPSREQSLLASGLRTRTSELELSIAIARLPLFRELNANYLRARYDRIASINEQKSRGSSERSLNKEGKETIFKKNKGSNARILSLAAEHVVA